jgi:hypothetical protein
VQVQNTNCYAIRLKPTADVLQTEVCFHKVHAVANRVLECGMGWLAHRGYAPNPRQGSKIQQLCPDAGVSPRRAGDTSGTHADALRTEVCFHKVHAVANRVLECGTGWLAQRGYAPNPRQGRLRSNERYWETRFGVWCPIIAFPSASHGAINRYALRASVMGANDAAKKRSRLFGAASCVVLLMSVMSCR